MDDLTDKAMSPVASDHWGRWVARLARMELFTSKAMLAREVGVHRKTILRWFECQRAPIASENLNRLAKALRITPKKLLLGPTTGSDKTLRCGMQFGEKLKRLTEGRSRAAVARDAGMLPSVVGNYINRGSEPMASAALRLAKAIGVDVAWLIDDSQSWPPPPAPTSPSVPHPSTSLADLLSPDRAGLSDRFELSSVEVRASYAVKHVGGSPARERGEGAGPMVPGVKESGQQSRFHPAPAETPARAFGSSRVGGV